MDAEGSSNKSFDWSPALSFVDGDSELLRDVVEAFLEECPTLMHTMRQAIDEGDGPSLRRAAHVMGSAMRTFALPGAQDAAERLEDLARHNQFESAGRYYDELKSQIDVILPAASALLQSSGGC